MLLRERLGEDPLVARPGGVEAALLAGLDVDRVPRVVRVPVRDLEGKIGANQRQTRLEVPEGERPWFMSTP